MSPPSGLRTFDGAVVFITGGASGIGAALGRNLARRGATVVLADRQEDLAREEAARIEAEGGKAEGHGLDVRDAAAVAARIQDVHRRYGRLDFLFNNAGTGVGGEVKDQGLDDFRYIVEVNLMGVVHGVLAAYPLMVQQGFGHIVNTASAAGLGPTPYTTAYSMTKHGVVGLSRSLRIEAEEYGVRVSVVCPGAVRTPILQDGGRFGRATRPVPREVQDSFWRKLNPPGPDAFAEAVVRRLVRNRAILVGPVVFVLLDWVNRLCRPAGEWLAGRLYRSMKAAFEDKAPGR